MLQWQQVCWPAPKRATGGHTYVSAFAGVSDWCSDALLVLTLLTAFRVTHEAATCDVMPVLGSTFPNMTGSSAWRSLNMSDGDFNSTRVARV
jgi:hypothetical protein